MKETISKTMERKILLNPGPATTTATVKSAQVVPDICPREKEFGELMASIRQMATDVVHGGEEYASVLLPGSGTGAMEACMTSCVDEGGEILIINNGAYGQRMEKICAAFDIKYNSLTYEWGDAINVAEVKTHLEQNQGRYKVLAFIHHETTTGILNPIAQLTALKKEHDLRVVVDAMSSYAGIPINVKELDVDYLISSSNKCIQGMAGIGIVIAKRNTLEEIKNYKTRNFYFNLYNNYANQNKGEFLFTPPVQTMYALKAAYDEYAQETEAGRWERYSSLYRQMMEGMKEMGFKLLIENEAEHSRILTSFIEPTHANYNFTQYHDYLYERGVTIYPGKNAKEETFRISNIGQLEKMDIDIFLKLTKEYLEKAGIDKLY